MEGAEKGGKGENGENQSLPPQIDPKCFHDALRSFFQPMKTDDPRLDFYAMYKKEAAEYDTNYIKKYDEDLNTTLIFAGLFSAVSSAFVIDIHSKLQPDPNDQSAALLHVILLTLNQSAIPGETLAPPVQEDLQSGIVAVAGLVYASLAISLLAAFIAMLGKQWLNRYSRKVGGSAIERCGDRQLKCDGIEKWLFYLFIEALPVMLQVALLLLASGLCRYMWSISPPVAWILIILTSLGVLFFLGIVIAGTSSYACPFQTPVSIALRTSWKKLQPWITSLTTHSKQALSRARRMRNQSILPIRIQSPPMILPGEIQPQLHGPWLEPNKLANIRRTNTNDVRCVSWILRNITDREALDTAIRLAGKIQWFEEGTDPEPPYDVIISAFQTCFDSNGNVYPGSRDRAYYSGRAIVWIHTRAACRSEVFTPEELTEKFPLFDGSYTAPARDHDLTHLLTVNADSTPTSRFQCLDDIDPGHTSSHSQWISNVLLHHSWAYRNPRDLGLNQRPTPGPRETIPPDVMFNRLLAWCICLGSSVEPEALEVQDKSYHLERILRQLSAAIVSAIKATRHRPDFISHVLQDLIRLRNRPKCLTVMAYEWCSAVCENQQSIEDWESVLLGSLEVGFRHLDLLELWTGDFILDHTEHHRGLVEVVFGSRNGEAISDLLHAWTAGGSHREPAHELLGTCTRHLVDLPDLAPFSSKLRQLLIRSVELIGYKKFEEAGVERFVQLLNHLLVDVEEMEPSLKWILVLLDTIKSPGGAQCLVSQPWKLLVGFVIKYPRRVGPITYNPEVITSLSGIQDWEKLEYWIAIVWMVWPPETEETIESLRDAMILLFRNRAGAAQELTQWVGKWGEAREDDSRVPESFKRIYEQAYRMAQQNLPLTPPASG